MMRPLLASGFLAVVALAAACAAAERRSASSAADRDTVAVYYFPQWHVGPANEKWRGKGWTEWGLVKDARPRFEGHQQPKAPLWGHGMEDDPKIMGRKIAAAASHNVDVFVFDWYWHKEGPFLNGALDRGFLGAKNSRDLKFAVMWANHGVMNRKGEVSAETFTQATDHMIRIYFGRPNYWRIDGKLYVSIFEVHTLIKGLGGVEPTVRALADFRERVRRAGLGELHLNAIAWPILAQLPEKERRGFADDNYLLDRLGFDSVTDYHWIQHHDFTSFPTMEYAQYRDLSFDAMREVAGRYKLPYYPVACMGWDSSPRCPATAPFKRGGYPWLPVLVNNTPAEFRKTLQMWKRFIDQRDPARRILMVNSWNEWTEGSYLEPDTRTGLQYLEAIRDVFGK
ncbi:MAG: glycoside hydrolase family 99-like domain-containing protein [bacterium]|nr:glycoside hydrolase family 99-like domain-containing protein [bacterium]